MREGLRCGFRSVRYLEVKIRCFGTEDSVRCSEFGGGRFSEVANVLQVWDFQSVTRALTAQGGSTVLISVTVYYEWTTLQDSLVSSDCALTLWFVFAYINRLPDTL